MKRRIALACALVALSFGRLALAQTLASAPSAARSGFYFRAGGGGGYSSGSYEFRGLSLSGPGFPPQRELTFDITLHGPQIGGHVAAGFGVIQGLALALEVGVLVLPAFAKHGNLGETSISAAVLSQLGPLLDFYPWRDEPSHFQLGVAFAQATLMGSTNDIGSPENIVELEPVSGPSIQGGFGYDFTASFGLTLRGSFAFLSNQFSDYKPGGIQLEAAYVLF